MPVDYLIVPVGRWPQGKLDPTEYSRDTGMIRVRADYDPVKDLHGWMVHERVHAEMHSIGFVEVGTYPHTNIEEAAYTAQFRHLIKAGKCGLDYLDLREIMPWKFHAFGSGWARDYWAAAVNDYQKEHDTCL